MPIKYGYKCFNKDMTNRYGLKYEVGKIYSCNKEVKFQKNGFHFCKNLEDTFRYFDAFNEEVKVCYVKGFGDINEFEDNYNEYYDMYASQNIEIIKMLSRDEIINYAINLIPSRVERFVSLFKLNGFEIDYFKTLFKNEQRIINAIEYYQMGNKHVYERR